MATHREGEPLHACSGSPRFTVALAVATTTAALGASVFALPVAATPTTTAPDQPYRIDVKVTDTSISIEHDRFTAPDGTTRYPRGALIDFIVRNVGKHPHVARFTLVSQHYFSKYELRRTSTTVGRTPIRPGEVRQLAVNFYFRGTFALQLMAGARAAASARIVIF